jgi:ribosomal protein L34
LFLPRVGALASPSQSNQLTPLAAQVRTSTTRNYWPRVREVKRQKMSYRERMKTPGGRRVIMRQYLKGKWVICH